jgi:hypothetical protein
MLFTIKNIFEHYYLEQNKIDMCIGYLFGAFSSILFMKYIKKTKKLSWITKENDPYKKSDILEILYQEYLNTGDKEYELYDECITFSNNNVKIKNKNYEQQFYRCLK